MAAEEKSRIKALHDVCRHFGKTRSQQTHEGPDGKEVIIIEDDSPLRPLGKQTTAADLSSLFGFRLTDSKAIIEGNDPLAYFRRLPTLPAEPVRIFDINTSKYGRWEPQNRFNVDQVPCCLYEGDQRTYDAKGDDKQVWIAGAGKGDDGKRFCTLQLCIRAVKIEGELYCGQPMPEICFRGQGKRLVKEERDFYAKCLKESRCSVRFQPKAWYDEATCLKYAQETFPRFTKEARRQGLESVLFVDNLRGQTDEDFIATLWSKAKTKVHLLPSGVTDLVQLVDAGFGKKVKDEIGSAHDEWCTKDGNIRRWVEGLEMWEKRVHMTKLLMAAYETACTCYDFEKNARKLGMLMTTDGSHRDEIDIQGIGNVVFSDEDGGSVGEGSVADEYEVESEGGRSSDSEQSDFEATTDSGSDIEDDTAEVDRSAAEGVGAATAPVGYSIVPDCPELITHLDHQRLIGRTILFKWNGTIKAEDFGWYMGKIHSRITKPNQTNMNFNVRYSNALTGHVLPAQLGKNFKGRCATGNVPHGLFPDSYGAGAPYEFHWVLLKKDDEVS